MKPLQIIDPKLPQGINYFSRPLAQQYDFYLSGEIVDAEEYVEWFDIIRNASTEDEVILHINSSGGDLYTTLQFLRIMGESQAHITCSVEGACMSAATMIFLHGDSFQVTPHSLFMIHNYSAGVFGKGGEMYDQLQFERAWSETFLHEVYADFLTSEEILSIMNNKDLWMTSVQVMQRLETVATARKARAELEQAVDTALAE